MFDLKKIALQTLKIAIVLLLAFAVYTDQVFAQSSPEEIDMLIIYTPAARNLEGSEQKIQIKANSLVNELNTSLQNSKNDTRFRLVKVGEIEYQEEVTEDAFVTLQNNLINITDSSKLIAKKVKELKNQAGADVVMMMTNLPPSSCGVAYSITKNIFNQAPPEYFSDHAAGIYNTKCFTMAFIHEVSHIMGNRHAGRKQSDAVTDEAYAYEFIDPQANPRKWLITITSGGVQDSTMIPYWSNPEVEYHGAKIGKYGSSCESCVANLTRSYIASISPKKTGGIVQWDLGSTGQSNNPAVITIKGRVSVPYSIISISTDSGTTWKEFVANKTEVLITLDKNQTDTKFLYKVNNGNIYTQNRPLIDPSNDTIQKSCSVSINKNEFTQGEAIIGTLTAKSSKNPSETARLLLKKVDNSKINPRPDGSNLIENISAGTNYYLLEEAMCQTGNNQSCSGTAAINALAPGKYQLHCDLPEEPQKCSGNPNCSYNGGPFSCDGWQSCGDKDFVTFEVKKAADQTPKITSPDYNKNNVVDIYDYTKLLQHFGTTNCSLNLIGECLLNQKDIDVLVGKYGK